MRILTIILSSLFFQIALFAQNKPFIKISGHVINPMKTTGVSNCKVFMTSTSGDLRRTITDINGFYSFDSLEAMDVIHWVTIEHDSFATESRSTKLNTFRDTIFNFELSSIALIDKSSEINSDSNNSNHVINKFLVISLSINDYPIYNNCILRKKIFDAATCLRLSFDTVTIGEKVDNYENKLFLALDTLTTPMTFSIVKFTASYFKGAAHICVNHTNSCFKDYEIEMLHSLKRKTTIYIENIYLNYNSGTTEIFFPSIIIYVK